MLLEPSLGFTCLCNQLLWRQDIHWRRWRRAEEGHLGTICHWVPAQSCHLSL